MTTRLIQNRPAARLRRSHRLRSLIAAGLLAANSLAAAGSALAATPAPAPAAAQLNAAGEKAFAAKDYVATAEVSFRSRKTNTGATPGALKGNIV